MSLSPWDLGADISFDFSLYRPRRASYLYATAARNATRAGQRNESYRHATKQASSVSSGGDGGVPQQDDATNIRKPINRKKRANSYRAAMKPRGGAAEPAATLPVTLGGPAACDVPEEDKTIVDLPEVDDDDNEVYDEDVNDQTRDTTVSELSSRRCTKNLVAISVGFVLIFSGFRALQNVASSLLGPRAGSAVLACVHGTALAVGLLSPGFVNRVGPRWALVIGALGYPVWIAANACVAGGFCGTAHDFTGGGRWGTTIGVGVLVAASMLVGIGQSVVWSAQVVYIRRLAAAFDLSVFVSSSPSNRGGSTAVNRQPQRQRKAAKSKHPQRRSLPSMSSIFRCNGFFLACFQTTHVWGNLVSSVLLGAAASSASHCAADDSYRSRASDWSSLMYFEGVAGIDGGAYCGTYDTCERPEMIRHGELGDSVLNSSGFACRMLVQPVTTMLAIYLILSVAGLLALLLLLDNLQRPRDRASMSRDHANHTPLVGTPETTYFETVKKKISQLTASSVYVYLVPMMLFNGFEQAFVYATYNKSYVGCTVGTRYIGYNMMTVGLTNALCSCLIGCAARHVPREALVGIGCVLHAALVVFLLVWIPDSNLLPVFFVVSALWGVCDAVWQTQTNGLVNQCCADIDRPTSTGIGSATSTSGVEPEIDRSFAFQTVRLAQGVGATTCFLLGATICDVSVQLYVLVALLSTAVLGYIVVEYRLRKRAVPTSGSISGCSDVMAHESGPGKAGENLATTGAVRRTP